jgi:phosphatidylinositol glycan class M
MNKLILSAITLRAGLLLFGSWQDTHFAVKYTDIDYEVYTDAAQFIVNGDSPYQRSTYRYSPLLAALLTPNILLHKSFGKVLFALADILAALLMQRIIHRRYKKQVSNTTTTGKSTAKKNQIPSFGLSLSTTTNLALALWLFSPFTVSISTRGNGEALVTCMLLCMLDLLERNYILASGMIYGFAVHWRVYPIIYALPLLKYLARGRTSKEYHEKSGGSARNVVERRITRNTSRETKNYNSSSDRNLTPRREFIAKPTFIDPLFSRNGFKFGLSAAGVFLFLGSSLYRLYGFPFLHETYLYHATRIDPRHNFSPYYYPAYLETEKGTMATFNEEREVCSISRNGGGGGGATSKIGIQNYLSSILLNSLGDGGKIWTLASLLIQISLGWAFSPDDLVAAFFLQTVAFVAFNKVATAQYFVWYFSWLPFVLPRLLQAPNKVKKETRLQI